MPILGRGHESRRENEISTGRKADDVKVCRSGIMVKKQRLWTWKDMSLGSNSTPPTNI